jgi:hypothetical protein
VESSRVLLWINHRQASVIQGGEEVKCLHTARLLLNPNVLPSLKKAVAVTPLLVSKF